jgi:hypothetical protein
MHPVGTKDHLSFIFKSVATGQYLIVGENGDIRANHETKGGNFDRSARYLSDNLIMIRIFMTTLFIIKVSRYS